MPYFYRSYQVQTKLIQFVHMRRLFSFFLCLSVGGSSFGQAFLSNDGVLISVRDHALLSVQGNCINRPSGHFFNTDTISLTGNWVNNSLGPAFDSSGAGIVKLLGAEQHIQGTNITGFHHLLLSGSDIKYGDLDVRVTGNLHFTDRELKMENHTTYVENTNPDAVTSAGGFLSSIADGGLSRQTSSAASYFFPVGSSSPALYYRPMNYKIGESVPNTFKTGFTAADPSIDGYNRDLKDYRICRINENYYHRLYHNTGSSDASLIFFYNGSDGSFNNIGHWQGSLWTHADTALTGSSGSFQTIEVNNGNDYSEKAFALAYVVPPFIRLGADTTIYLGQSVDLTISGGTTYTWTPATWLSCDNCQNPSATPEYSTTYFVVSERQDGCRYADSIHINVIRDLSQVDLFIPNLFTPNGDGANDKWVIRDLQKFPDNEVVIMNRWGDAVFKKEPYDDSFDGKLWGKDLPEGTYYYILKVKIEGDVKAFDGPLTIVR